jgi:hypothetical protein
MPTELVNGFGKVYLTIEYDAANNWVYNNWIGEQTYVGVVAGADACLHPLRENACAYLLNDHAVKWVVNDWGPRAQAQGLTHFANVVSPEALAALSAQAMYLGLGERLQMRMFDDIGAAQAWLHAAQQATA